MMSLPFDFFSLHPGFRPDTFFGNPAFGTIETFGMLLNDFHYSKALIPYNPRNKSTLKKVGYNKYGYPTCPNEPSPAMKHCGITLEKGRAGRIKWICPKVHMVKGKYMNWKSNYLLTNSSVYQIRRLLT